jgi:hypothetical protein
MGNIDWTNAQSQVTDHFTVGDALTLHQWNRLATEADGADFDALVTLCQKMEEIRTFLGCPINVHCMYRSPAYNQLIGAPTNDVHSQSLAADLDCNGSFTIDELHSKLEPVLEQYGVRMERGTTSWIHLDLHPVGNARYFNP